MPQLPKSAFSKKKWNFFQKHQQKMNFSQSYTKNNFFILLQTSNCNFDLKIRIKELFCFKKNYPRLISDFGRWSCIICQSRLFLRKNGIFPKNISKKRIFPKASQKIIFLFYCRLQIAILTSKSALKSSFASTKIIHG